MNIHHKIMLMGQGIRLQQIHIFRCFSCHLFDFHLIIAGVSQGSLLLAPQVFFYSQHTLYYLSPYQQMNL